MIFDRMANWKTYPYGDAWATAFSFLESLSADAAEGRHELRGDDIYAMVMSYDTREPEAAALETHRKYVDIQMALAGEEGCEWFPREGLEVKTPYDSQKDAEFYLRTRPGPLRVDISPGTFATFFPQDAHMPALTVGGVSRNIKKVVVKIRLDLLTPSAG